MSSELWTYQGRHFSPQSLKFLKPSFAEAYAEAMRKFGDRDFLKVYRTDEAPIEKSFLEFSRDVEQVRRYLLNAFPTAEVIVTIDGNTYENLVYMTATLLAGFVLAPFNYNDTAERSLEKIKQIGQSCGICLGRMTKFKLESACPMTIPQSLADIPSKQSSVPRPFIYIFTSGSTGYSKIVEQTETGILSNVDALIELHGLEKQKTIATPLPIFHVNALEFSFFCSLLSGQKLVLYEGFQFFQLLESLEKDQVQILSVVPHILKSLCDLAPKILEKKLSLDYCVSAASSLSPELAKKLSQTFPFKIIQGYGLSEAVNFSTKLLPSLSKERIDHWLCDFPRPSIGVPIRGNDVFVLDEKGSRLGENAEGEICVRGFNVMKSYKDQTDGRVFAQDYLHTGDRGFFRICEQTSLPFFFISGRQKDVIKRFGLTVSLVEIDDQLLKWSLPGVTAIAVSFENASAGEELAVVVQGSADLESLKTFLENSLPAFMRPRLIKSVERNLRTDSGKPQRWSFSSLFEKYQKTSFTEKVLIDL